MRFRFLLLCLFSLLPIAFAETINFSLHSVTVPVEWSESWFGEKPSSVYNHNLARAACFFADAAYSDVAENPRSNDMFNAYKKLGVQESDIEARYNINYSDPLWGNDQCAFSIASKKIRSAVGQRTLLIVVVRGTPFNANEWISNLNISDVNKMQEPVHRGFARAADTVHTALISYMLRHQINPTESFLFMTGHSRGAAVVNLLSARVAEDDFFSLQNIYTYTFASPNVTTVEDAESEKYGFIWNIVNAEDIVPTVPMNRASWKFRKFGHTLAFANLTNTDRRVYFEDYIPRINAVYEKCVGRPYSPFTTGPFVPILVTKLVLHLSEDVESFYNGAIDLHSRAENVMNRLFPENQAENTEQSVERKPSRFGSWFYAWLNNRLSGRLPYVTQAFFDMHFQDAYLSYMLALKEDEAFSDVGYSVIVMKGYEEFAVFDASGNMVARVFDGRVSRSDSKLPVILSPAFANKVIVGYPANLDYKIVVTDEALVSSPVLATVEFFDAAGVYKSSQEKKLYARRNRVYQADLGKSLYESETFSLEKMPKDEGKKIIESAALRPQFRFKVTSELAFNTDFNLGFALHIGTPALFGSLMASQGLTRIGESGEVGVGIGNQQTLYSQLKFENEIFGKLVFLNDSELDDRVVFVPELRSSLSLRLLGRLRFFTAGVFDFQIEDFNDSAFKSDSRKTSIDSFRITGNVRAAPSIQFGFRF